MPPFSHLRSDYPLNLTLLEHAHACPLTWFYIAGRTPRTILTSPLRHNGPFPISFYQKYCTNSCSFACVPLARKSPFGLRPARASLQRVPVSYRRAFDDSNRTSMCKSLNSISLRCRHRRCSVDHWHVPLLGSVLQRGTEGVHSVVSPLCRAVRGHRSKSSQIRRNT
jgi:hypothetical protein